jgi:uncharacterized membrane protein YbhN (UPF0104 family)
LKTRLIKYGPPLLGLLVLSGIVVGLHGALKRIGLGDVVAALAAMPRRDLWHALLLLAASAGVMMAYDVPGVVFSRAKLRLRQIALASFCAYALSHVLGAAALSSAAVRVRFYAPWGVPPSGIARIIALSGSMFSLGVTSLLSLILLLRPSDLPLFGHNLADPALRLVGAGLAAVVIFYITQRSPGARIFGREIPLPGTGLALAQIALSCVDITLACGIFYAVLPNVPGLTYAHVLAVYLAAFAGGLFSGLPGGVGVFDSLLLLGLSGFVDPATALGAILLFRVLYFLLPACAAALCYAAHEVWCRVPRNPGG